MYCANLAGITYRRILREGDANSGWSRYVQWVPDADAAIAELKQTKGNILLTTGSKTLGQYAEALPPERIYARVLPTSGVLKSCEVLGILPGHVIAMQGPFTQALNAAMYDAYSIRVLVSKDSGDVGGVSDKVIPALNKDIQIIMIERPKGE